MPLISVEPPENMSFEGVVSFVIVTIYLQCVVTALRRTIRQPLMDQIKNPKAAPRLEAISLLLSNGYMYLGLLSPKSP